MKRTSLQEKLNIKYPIFQAPMAGGCLSPDFIAQVTQFGILGSIPCGYLDISQIQKFINSVKSQTDQTFSLNLFVDYTLYSDEPIKKPDEIIAIEKNYFSNSSAIFSVPPPPLMDDLVQLIIDNAVPIVSTTFGLLSLAHVTALKDAGIKIMTTINSVYEMDLAIKTQQPDVLIYQNSLAGGHKGGFTPILHSNERDILERIQKYNNIHCVLAGGIVNKQDINSALDRGFDGVQIGSSFLATQESSISKKYKMAIVNACETTFTASITGKLARGLKNPLACLNIKENLGFPYMHYATADLRKLAKENEDLNFQSLWCGDGVKKILKIQSVSDYMKSLVL